MVGADGEQVGIVTIEEALEAAAAASLDLVEIAPEAEPPVCKVMDYGKKLFEQKKQAAAQKKKQKQTQVKEMKFRPGRGRLSDQAEKYVSSKPGTRPR